MGTRTSPEGAASIRATTLPSRRRRPRTCAVAVVIPAHDEAETIGAAVDSVLRAARVARCPVRVVVVADACRDATARIARGRGAEVLEIDRRSVGAARRAGFEHVLAGTDDPDALWLATTDADTLVAPPWLARQLRHRAGGAELLLGTVDVRRGTLTARRRALWRLDYARRIRRRTHGHVHGANLGISARAYLELGGFRPLAHDEDVDLADRARTAGLRIVRATDLAVLTSGRLVGRAPAGFAHFLKEIP